MIPALFTGLSVMFNLAANLVSGRLGYFGPWLAPMGVFFFPFIYIISDITSDVYGYGKSRFIAWISALSNIVFALLILLVITVIPPAPFAVDADNALRLLLVGSSTSGMLRVMTAGIIGAVIGGWVNDIIFQLYRHKDGTAHFYKRKYISSLAAEAADTLVFITLAFAGTPGWSIAMYLVQFVLKYGVEVITSPIACFVSKKIRNKVGEGVFEDRNNFNIFGVRK